MYWEDGMEQLKSLTNRYAADHRCVVAWQTLNPTWDVRVLDKESVSIDMAPLFFGAVHNETMARKMKARMRADLLRVELLSRYGGVWADTSTCPLIGLDSFLTEWIGTDRNGFYAPILTLEAMPRHVFTRVRGSDLPENVTACHHGGKYGGWSRTHGTWFLASRNPHNPLLEEWLKIYHDHLVNEPKPTEPYFLCHCSLTQARRRNSTVDDIWTNTVKRWERLEENGWAKRPCIDKGKHAKKYQDVAWYRDHCALLKKSRQTRVRDYLLSRQYMEDIVQQ